MARLAKRLVYAALENAAANILSAAGDDPFVSRKDIRLKLRQLLGIERGLTDMLYRFIDKRDYKPGARVTKKDVDAALAYSKEKLIDSYDENNNGLSEAEIQEMSLTAQLAVRYAQILQSFEAETPIDSSEKLKAVLERLGGGLFFPAWANEADAYLKLFHRTTSLSELTSETFAQALDLDTSIPAEQVYFFHQGRGAYGWIWENYTEYPEDFARFERLHDFMSLFLRDLTHIIVGQDGLREDSEYPVYLVGLNEHGELFGFETTTVWT